VAAAVLTTLLTGGAAHARPAPPRPPTEAALAAQAPRQDMTREQFYFLLPDRFANGDPSNDTAGIAGDRLDHGFDPTDEGFYQGGDLRGVIDHLDYIAGMGTTAIWLAPIFENKPVQGTGDEASAGYHGYWVTDFTRVDPHLGTNDDLAELIDEAHARGMKVFFDVITNHTADVIHQAEGTDAYLSRGAFPYLTEDGRPFDDRAHAGERMPDLDTGSFPYTPVVAEGEEDLRSPAWLNDPTMYHNRGNSTFTGENSLHGEHTGLDDLFTERPEVVAGLTEIYRTWVEDFDIDGFRIDTVKHVGMEFWTEWATALDAYAAERGRPDFFMFGEVNTPDPAEIASYVTEGELDGALDFPLQGALRSYVSQGGSARRLSEVFAEDHRYTTDQANAYNQVTFTGNHDMGRLSWFLTADHPDAGDAELLRRAMLANELIFLSRGNPVVYYGDEQGFTGDGNDKQARQTMFASATPAYLDDDLIGTDRTHADDAFDTSHPLYRGIAALSELTREHPALRDGVQTVRYADDGPGVHAHTRTDPADRTEYLVAANNATEPRTVTVPVGTAGTAYRALYGDPGATTVTSTAGGSRGPAVTLTVPALSTVVLRAAEPLPVPDAAPAVELTAPPAGARGTVRVTAEATGDSLARVVFAARTGRHRWEVLGTDDQAPYEVTHTIDADTAAGTEVAYQAVVVDGAGRTASDLATTTAGATPPPAPPSPVDRDWALVHYQRPDGDYTGWRLRSGDRTGEFLGRDAFGAFAWLPLADGEDTARLPFTIERADGTTDGPARTLDLAASGAAWVVSGDDAARPEPPAGAYPEPDTAVLRLHYHRPDGDTAGWGLHVWGDVARPTDWAAPLAPVGEDAFGPVFEIPLAPGATSVGYIVHRGDEKDHSADQSVDLRVSGHEVWRLAGTDRLLAPASGGVPELDLGTRDAHWIDRDTVVWDVAPRAGGSVQLVYDRAGRLAVEDGALTAEGRWLRLVPAELTAAQRAAHPDLAGLPAFRVDPRDADRIAEARRPHTQVIATGRAPNGALTAATTVRRLG
jgi:glycosidase